MDYLATFSIGPVQGFIATARRTRDLWFGSALLSDIAGAAAGSLASREGVELIFPALAGTADPDLSSCPNVLLAKIATEDPAGLAEELRECAAGKDRDRRPGRPGRGTPRYGPGTLAGSGRQGA